MSDEVYRELHLPEIPDSFNREQRQYLIDLQDILIAFFVGDIEVSGNLNLGGKIYARDTTGVIKELYNNGVFGN
jgi:hypothetical protein